MQKTAASYTKLVLVISFVLSLGLVLFIAFNANTQLNRMSANNSELYSAYKISQLIKAYRSELVQFRNKQRGYMITGDARFAEEFKMRETQIKTYLNTMEKYFEGKTEAETFFRLKDFTYKELMEAKDLKSANDLSGFQGKMESGEEKQNLQSEIQTLITALETSLDEKTKSLLDNSVQYVMESRRWSIMEVIFGVFVSITALFLLLRDISLRNSLQKELAGAKVLAEENARLKERFLANMSHEIRTPMNAILGFAELLNKTELETSQKEYLSAIRTSGSNLLNILNDVLDISKIEAGKLHLENIQFSVKNLAHTLQVMFGSKAEEKKIKFNVEVDENIPASLSGDPTRISQILVNLINNAIKFTDKGSVAFSAKLKHIRDGKADLEFSVKDTGIGIDAEKTQNIFERFSQANSETTRKYGGTGLGLAIVKELVDLMNGDIHVKSSRGTGTEFLLNLSLPVSVGEQLSETANKNVILPLSDGKKKVLIVEDNELNQKLSSVYLEGFGLKAEVAENGMQALEKLKGETFDLVLLDIQMPIMDGFETAEKIRKALKLDLPVVAMTANVLEGEKQRCLDAGMSDYIAKPFKEAELYEMMKKHLQEDKTEKVNDGAVVDFKMFRETTRGNNKFAGELINIFLDKNPGELERMEEAIAKTDTASIKSIAHKLKTSLGFIGLGHLNGKLEKIEQLAGENGSIDEIVANFGVIKENCIKAKKELTRELENMKL